MAKLGNFDATSVKPQVGFEPLPAGDDYPAVIINSEEKPNRARNGSYVELTFQIIAGSFKNRLLWTRLNLNNPNERAVEFAEQELSALCHAVGVMQPQDTSELHNRPVLLSVVQERMPESGAVGNKITGYKKAPPEIKVPTDLKKEEVPF